MCKNTGELSIRYKRSPLEILFSSTTHHPRPQLQLILPSWYIHNSYQIFLCIYSLLSYSLKHATNPRLSFRTQLSRPSCQKRCESSPGKHSPPLSPVPPGLPSVLQPSLHPQACSSLFTYQPLPMGRVVERTHKSYTQGWTR